jgi:hypothetical protein
MSPLNRREQIATRLIWNRSDTGIAKGESDFARHSNLGEAKLE